MDSDLAASPQRAFLSHFVQSPSCLTLQVLVLSEQSWFGAVWVSWNEASGALLGKDQQPWGGAGLAPLWFSFVPPAWLSSVSSAQAAAQHEVSLKAEQVEHDVKLKSLFLDTSSTFLMYIASP